MRWLDLPRVLATLSVALVVGLSFAHVLESSAKMAYPAPLYIELQKTLYVQWGPPQIGGFLEPFAIAATGLFAFRLRQQKLPFRFTLTAFLALLLAFPVVFFLLVAPANAAFHSATSSAFLPNWADLRDRWELGHALRFGLHFAALVSLVLSRALDAVKLGPRLLPGPLREPIRDAMPINNPSYSRLGRNQKRGASW